MIDGANDLHIVKSKWLAIKVGEWIDLIMRIIKFSLANHGQFSLPNIPTTRYAKYWPNLYMSYINQSLHKACHLYSLKQSLVLLATAPDLQKENQSCNQR